jgi:paired amphipathic helix protein Sin3a
MILYAHILFCSSATGAIERAALSRREEARRKGGKDSRSKKRSQDSFRGSVTNERRFFERVKEVLPRQGGRDLWSELLKCLDLYSQEVLERAEMISLVADLFGKHTDLFNEFKSMLNERGTQENDADKMW